MSSIPTRGNQIFNILIILALVTTERNSVVNREPKSGKDEFKLLIMGMECQTLGFQVALAYPAMCGIQHEAGTKYFK